MNIFNHNRLIEIFETEILNASKNEIGDVLDIESLKEIISIDSIGISILLNGEMIEPNYVDFVKRLTKLTNRKENEIVELLNDISIIMTKEGVDTLLNKCKPVSKKDLFEIEEFVQNSSGDSHEVNQFGKYEDIQNLDDSIRIATKKRDEWNKKVTELNDAVNKLRADAPKEQGPPLKKLKKELNDLEFRHMTSTLSEEKERELIDRMKKLVKQIEEKEREMSEDSEIGSAISELREARDQAEVYHNQVFELNRIKDDCIGLNHDFSYAKKMGVSNISGNKTEGSSVDKESKYYRFTSLGGFWYIDREVFDSMAIQENLEVELFFDKSDPHYGYALLPVTKLSKNSITFDLGTGIIEPDID